MVKKIAAIAGGVFIGLVIAFARVGAFPFWGTDSDASKGPSAQQSQQAPQSMQAQAAPEPLPAPPVPGEHVAPPVQPAEPNTPEPNEKVGVITSFAPLVKKMIPAVVVAAETRSTSCGATSARADSASTSSMGWARA